MIGITSKVKENEWREFLEKSESATIYHTPEWKEVLEKSFGYKPYYLFAEDEENKLCGILPLFQVKSLLTGNRLVSLPFSYICGPIADSDDILRGLVSDAKRLCDELRCRYLELKLQEQLPSIGLNLTENDCYSTFILMLSSKTEEVWRRFSKKSVRWGITKSEKDGVRVRLASTVDDFKFFSELNQKNKKGKGVPTFPFTFFQNIWQRMYPVGCVDLYLAELNGERIAGAIFLKFRGTITYAFAASDDRYLMHRPNNLVLWRAIEDGCKGGHGYFDLGRALPDNKGLIAFKKRWGTEEKKIYYYYYPQMPNLLLNERGLRYRILTGVWKRTPMVISRRLDPYLLSNFG
ncbi:hypothetical protein C5S29_07125 [ANME-1 cluster archaeon GoMg3.2]|nr:hypothetical protein [ANME-1 cluster archaeon GoMg3.2]